MLGIIDFGFFLENLTRFWPAFLIELAVIVFVYKTKSRELGSLGRRLTVGRMDTLGLWGLPLYLWAWQANLLVSGLFSDREGLAYTTRIHDDMEAIFVALFHLLMFQTIGTIITNNAPATMGLIGHARTAVTAAMLSVFLNTALFFWVL